MFIDRLLEERSMQPVSHTLAPIASASRNGGVQFSPVEWYRLPHGRLAKIFKHLAGHDHRHRQLETQTARDTNIDTDTDAIRTDNNNDSCTMCVFNKNTRERIIRYGVHNHGAVHNPTATECSFISARQV